MGWDETPPLGDRIRWKLDNIRNSVAWHWRALCERAKWIGYTPSPLENHARRELELAGWYGDADNDGFGIMMAEDTMALIRSFCEAGHSGMSAGASVSLFRDLVMYKILTPLTGEDDEWMDISEDRDGTLIYQNKRASHVFKYVTPTETYVEDIQGRAFREPSGACYTSSDSRVRVTFPYTPKTEYVDMAAAEDE